ncbi:MAG: S24 family peptidase [Candidatus Sulfotelmatobacter sp.]
MPSTLETREDPKLGLAAEMLRRRGTIHLKAWGTSMLPSVWPGDLLTIQNAAYDEVIPGDITLVLRDNRFFVHRLVEKRLGPEIDNQLSNGGTNIYFFDHGGWFRERPAVQCIRRICNSPLCREADPVSFAVRRSAFRSMLSFAARDSVNNS